MSLIKLALDNPVATLVGCLLVTVFGVIALTDLPVQLTPDIERPVIVTDPVDVPSRTANHIQ